MDTDGVILNVTDEGYRDEAERSKQLPRDEHRHILASNCTVARTPADVSRLEVGARASAAEGMPGYVLLQYVTLTPIVAPCAQKLDWIRLKAG